MIAGLAALARHGRLVLVLGLALDALAPPLAEALAPYIFEMIALLLFLAALRVDLRAAFPGRRSRPRSLAITALMQLALPVAAILALRALGASGTTLRIGLVLVLAAPPLTGSPGLTILAGGDPTPALRQLVPGTALPPLTVLSVFWLLPVFGAPGVGVEAALLLLVALALTRHRTPRDAPALSIIAGNRNLALFLGALPPETVAARLLFVGLYRVPMYLTPLVMAPLIRRFA